MLFCVTVVFLTDSCGINRRTLQFDLYPHTQLYDFSHGSKSENEGIMKPDHQIVAYA